jgi:hypothetical protein
MEGGSGGGAGRGSVPVGAAAIEERKGGGWRRGRR